MFHFVVALETQYFFFVQHSTVISMIEMRIIYKILIEFQKLSIL